MGFKGKHQRRSRLWVEGDVLRSCWGKSGWELPIADIVLIGEHTDESGPFSEDWWLEFVCRRTGRGFSHPMYGETVMNTLGVLSDRMGVDLLPWLASSTTFASLVMYPECLIGSPLYTYLDTPGPFLIGRLLGFGRVRAVYSEQIRAHLEDEGVPTS